MNNEIILGTVQFGTHYGINNSQGKLSESEVFQILDFATISGITTLDTAAAYGNAEQLIGDYMKVKGAQFDIITKAHSSRDGVEILDTFEESLKRLNALFVDTLLFHRVVDLENSNQLEKVISLKKQGLVKRIGVSIYDVNEFNSERFKNQIDIVQLPFNILDSSNEKREAVEMLSEHFEIHARSVFLQGLFFKASSSFPAQLESLKSRVMRIQQIAKEQKCHLSGLAARYVLSKKYISKIVIGVDNLNQLKTTLAEIETCTPSAGAVEELDRIQIEDARLLNPQNWHQ